jgi:single-strand DNA-binding protein
MADINHVILIGRLTRDAELKYTTGGTAVCKFSIAVNKKKKQGETWIDEANFFDVTAWAKLAETLSKYLVKGKQVAIDGELQQDRWEKDGQSHSKVTVNAGNIQLLGGGDAKTTESKPAQQAREDTAPPDFPDDIPF